MPELRALPRTPDGGYRPDAVAEVFAAFAKATAGADAHLEQMTQPLVRAAFRFSA